MKSAAPAIGVWVPLSTAAPPPPADWPLGRAALALEAEGIPVIFGDTLRAGKIQGWRAINGWTSVGWTALRGLYDRFPSQSRESDYRIALEASAGLPVGNPPEVISLCRDKLALQRHLEEAGVVMPEVEEDSSRFLDCLREWGAAFAKPRYGSLGVGVRRVRIGDEVTSETIGLLGTPEPTLLQRAVTPPAGWAGISVRALMQRSPGGGWCALPAVARRSQADAVVNAHRGAEVAPAEDVLGDETLAEIYALSLAAAEAISKIEGGIYIVELGMDCVVSADGRAHLIEVNGRPRGRLEVLARQWPSRFTQEHQRAVERPLRYLAGVCR